MKLTSQQRKYLKGLGHSLSPVIHVGKEGITDNLVASVKKALDDHELIKIALLDTSDLSRPDAAEKLCIDTNSEMVQILGKKILLYKANPKKKCITLPK